MPIPITTIRRYREQARNHSPSATRMVSASLRRARRLGSMTGALLIVVASYLSFASPASAANTCGTNGVLSAVGNVYTCTYTASGEDTFTVPLFVTEVHIVAVGQTGGTACAFEGIRNTGNGGSGARVAASLPVTQPTLFVEVPFSTPPASGCGGQSQITLFGGGGGGNGTALGGGASVVQTCSVNTSCLLTGVPQTDPRLVVAGGGGGAAFDGINGGDAGTGGNPVCNPGLAGGTGPNAVDGRGGTGGSCQSFGVGGQGGTGPGGFSHNGLAGDNGWIGKGGDGGAIALNPVPNDACSYPWPGAGGGVGFWGGGGGGGAAYCSGGGGGGGSSYAEPVATNVSMTLDDEATPSVSISWVQPTNREYQFLTGRAIGLSFTQSPPSPAFSLTSADTGSVSTSQSATFSAPCVPILSEPVGGPGTTTITEVKVCAEVKTTGGPQSQSNSIATSSTGLLTLRIPGLPIVRARTVISASKTTCAGSTGGTFISFLSIGGDVVISHPQAIAPDTHLTVGPFSVNLNEQTPFTLQADKGLIVDAITLSFGAPKSVTGHLIVASSESDIGDCPGQLPIS
jgi:hypothetical protein